MAAPAAAVARRAAGQLARRELKRRRQQNQGDDGGGGVAGKIAALLTAALIAFLLFLMILLIPFAVLFGSFGGVGSPDTVRSLHSGGMPVGALPFLDIYRDAAAVYDVNPFLLMAVHEDETNFSLSEARGVRTGVNFAGCCAGPMQFLIKGGATPAEGGEGGTWAGYRHAFLKAGLERPARYPNRFERHPNVYDSYDAIYAAAKYFSSMGAGPQLDGRTLNALRRYKGTPPASEPFAQHDYARAKELEARAAAAEPIIKNPFPVGPRGWIDNSGNAHVRPSDPFPKEVDLIYQGGNEIKHKSYLLLHYTTHINSPTYDCSSSTSHALWKAGLFGRQPRVSDTFRNYGDPGVGRWVTIWVRPGGGPNGHVFLVVGGLRWDTARWSNDRAIPPGTGPRWTANLDPLKTVYQEGFIPRHPPGL